ncbi:STAS domain-containing protein [Pseudomonas sp. CM25]|uniref:STAS domain-containing protein n=1 Tax=unclassified Pseudomonas TaxID=196821 RepID=UPI0015527D73|nr:MULTISPECIES: STAS domain-containing protein [unclassified Pseudomonas]NQD54482.1 STAS domain-containing protein [Pseudomonas sp. CM25]NQD77908.1 STAS domain-containing protein [Pseudomonas sp. CM27]HEN8797689.1 STAS domain-containing protein [Pseudomonas putida]
MAALHGSTSEAIKNNQAQLQKEWLSGLETNGATRNIKEQVLAQETREFLQLLVEGLLSEGGSNLAATGWEGVRRFLEKLSVSRAQLGHDSHQAVYFIFALKGPLFGLLQSHFSDEPARLAEQLWAISELIDGMGMHTIRTFQKTREDVIKRQQEELLELSTPVVKLWDGVLALPLIGTLDSQRSQTVMESLLQRIVDTGSEIAIIDITGVPTVDTLVAQHLLKTVTAIRLMGADCIISGVRPQIAQTIVHLGLDLGTLTTKSNLADALKLALARLGGDIGKQV